MRDHEHSENGVDSRRKTAATRQRGRSLGWASQMLDPSLLPNTGCMVLVGYFAVLGLGVAHFGITPHVRALTAAAGLPFLGAVGVYVAQRIAGLVYDWPMRRAAAVRSVVGRWPATALLMLGVLAAGIGASEAASVAAQSSRVPIWFRATVCAAVFVAIWPLWLAALHPRAVFRASRTRRASDGASGSS